MHKASPKRMVIAKLVEFISSGKKSNKLYLHIYIQFVVFLLFILHLCNHKEQDILSYKNKVSGLVLICLSELSYGLSIFF